MGTVTKIDKYRKLNIDWDLMEQKANEHKAIINSVSGVKEEIKKEVETPKVKMMFSFMPYDISRTSPFFPMPRNAPRPLISLEFENSWGRITIEGRKLSIYDESILLAILAIVAKNKSETVQTTIGEVLNIIDTTKGKDQYNAVWSSLKRLTGTRIDLDIWQGKGSKKKLKPLMTNTILIGGINKNNNKLQITVNPYFMEAYAESLIANIDLNFRLSLKGDLSKALYRFYESQHNSKYQCHVLTIAKAVNLDVTLPMFRIRDQIRRGNAELRSKGYLLKHEISKSDVMIVWKDKKQLK